MKKIFLWNLLALLITSNAFCAEDSILNPKAVSEILGKYSSYINQNYQTKIMVNCVSDYVNKKVLDLEHFLHCCKSTVGRDTANLGVCNNMGRDMRNSHNKYQEADANNIAVLGQTCDIFNDKPQSGVFCPENFAPGAWTCSATCNSATHRWDFKIETCEKGWKPASNNMTCVVDPLAMVQKPEAPRHNGDCDSSKDKSQKNVACPSDFGATTSCDLDCIGGKWNYSINGCKEGSAIGQAGMCLAKENEIGSERKYHEPCTQEDLPNGAASGWYITNKKNPDGLGCAAKTCKDNYYLVRNAKGDSMGWCKYGKDPEVVKREEAEELARLKAENANLEILKPEIKGLDIKPVSVDDIATPGAKPANSNHESIESLTPPVQGLDVKPVSANDVKIVVAPSTPEEVVIKNCKQSDLSALHATAGTERGNGCEIQKCMNGYHLESNACVKNVVYPSVGTTCPDNRFKDIKYQLPANGTQGTFVKIGNDIECSATSCINGFEVVVENGKGVCKKEIAKLPSPIEVQKSSSTYVAPTFLPQQPQQMPQQNYLFQTNVPAMNNNVGLFFKQG